MLKRIWAFWKDLFWIAKLDRRAQQTNQRLLRYFAWFARFALWFASIGIPLLAIISIANGDYFTLALLPVELLLFPFMMRLVIRMNVAMNGLSLNENDQ